MRSVRSVCLSQLVVTDNSVSATDAQSTYTSRRFRRHFGSYRRPTPASPVPRRPRLSMNQPDTSLPEPLFSPLPSAGGVSPSGSTSRSGGEGRYSADKYAQAQKEYEDWLSRKAEREAGIGQPHDSSGGKGDGFGQGSSSWQPRDREPARFGYLYGANEAYPANLGKGSQPTTPGDVEVQEYDQPQIANHAYDSKAQMAQAAQPAHLGQVAQVQGGMGMNPTMIGMAPIPGQEVQGHGQDAMQMQQMQDMYGGYGGQWDPATYWWMVQQMQMAQMQQMGYDGMGYMGMMPGNEVSPITSEESSASSGSSGSETVEQAPYVSFRSTLPGVSIRGCTHTRKRAAPHTNRSERSTLPHRPNAIARNLAAAAPCSASTSRSLRKAPFSKKASRAVRRDTMGLCWPSMRECAFRAGPLLLLPVIRCRFRYPFPLPFLCLSSSLCAAARIRFQPSSFGHTLCLSGSFSPHDDFDTGCISEIGALFCGVHIALLLNFPHHRLHCHLFLPLVPLFDSHTPIHTKMVQFGMTPPPFHASLPQASAGLGMSGMGGMGGMPGLSGGSVHGLAYGQPGSASLTTGSRGSYGGVGFGLPGGGNPSSAGVVGMGPNMGMPGLGMVEVPEGMEGMALRGEQPYMSNLSISALMAARQPSGPGSMAGSSGYGYGSQRQAYGHGQALAMATAQYMAKGYGKGCVICSLCFDEQGGMRFGLRRAAGVPAIRGRSVVLGAPCLSQSDLGLPFWRKEL